MKQGTLEPKRDLDAYDQKPRRNEQPVHIYVYVNIYI